MLDRTIDLLKNRSARQATSVEACCEATEACLRQQVKRNAASGPVAEAPFRSEEQARRWLGGGTVAGDDSQIRYVDELRHSAIIRRSDGREQNWKYLSDCWQNTDKPRRGETTH